MWLDDCRIPFVDGNDIPQATTQRDSEEMNHKTKEQLGYEKWGVGMDLDVNRVPYEQNQQGRFTPNLLVCDDMLNDGSVCGGGKHSGAVKRRRKGFMIGDVDGYSNSPDNYGDKGSSSRYYDLDKWFDKIIDEIR